MCLTTTGAAYCSAPLLLRRSRVWALWYPSRQLYTSATWQAPLVGVRCGRQRPLSASSPHWVLSTLCPQHRQHSLEVLVELPLLLPFDKVSSPNHYLFTFSQFLPHTLSVPSSLGLISAGSEEIPRQSFVTFA
ncbi:hypothetical protein DL93DRAFT_940031 [Clavulina sp. PMI_390]|nr:hypothetical protein DL93DRAFT_940031 [Clavulina sp. PMI_390]